MLLSCKEKGWVREGKKKTCSLQSPVWSAAMTRQSGSSSLVYDPQGEEKEDLPMQLQSVNLERPFLEQEGSLLGETS